jgi:hypothetical protein
MGVEREGGSHESEVVWLGAGLSTEATAASDGPLTTDSTA